MKVEHSRGVPYNFYHILTAASRKVLSYVVIKKYYLFMRKISEEHTINLRTIDVERNLGSTFIVIFIGIRGSVLSV